MFPILLNKDRNNQLLIGYNTVCNKSDTIITTNANTVTGMSVVTT